MRPIADAALPGLAAALDADALLGLLHARLPECREEVDLEEARIFDVQYQPGAKGLVLYQLKLRGRHGGRSQRQLVSVRALPPGKASAPPSEEALRRYGALDDCALRTPYLPLPEVGLDVYAFPLDPVLAPLLRAFEPGPMRAAFQELWRSRGVRVRRVRARRLGYTPLARAAIAYEVLSEDRASGAPELRNVVGKIQVQQPASALFAKAWAAWRAARLRVRLAPPVGYLPLLHMHLQEHVEGTRLGDLAGSPTFGKWTREAARSLARFHALSIPVASRRGAAKEIQVVERWSALVAALRPDLAPRAARLRERLAPSLEARARARGPLHGDFHPANVLVGQDHVTLIDLDQMARGDPALDAGRFLASLRVSALRVAGDPEALQGVASAFLDEYLTHAREEEERVRLFEAACLLTAAASGFRLQRDGWEQSAEALLEEAERTVERADGPAARAPSPRAKGGAEGGAEWCHDPVYMRAVLDGPILEAYGAVATACRVRPARPRGGVERVRYDLSGRRAGERWRVSVEGVVGARRGALERLVAVRDALAGRADGPLLPRPLAYCGPLRLLVVERLRGTPLGSLLGDPAGPGAAAAAGRALAAAHATPLASEGELDLEDELRRAARRVAELAERRPRLRAELESTWRAAEARLRESATAPPSPLWSPSPEDVLWCRGRIAFTPPARLAAGHPLLDAAHLLARLRRRGVEKGAVDEAEPLAECFRQAYREARRVASAELAAFETMALLRAACQAAKGRAPDAADALVGLAAATLAGRSSEWHSIGAEASVGRAREREASEGASRARLRGALARECRGVTGLVGPPDPALARTLAARGLPVRELELRPAPGDAGPGEARTPELDTILIHGVVERLSSSRARALLRDARARLRPDGRLVVCVPHEVRGAPGGGRGFDRRRLQRLLRPLGSPRLVSCQPYRWLVMTVRTRPSPGVRERYRVIADLCRGRVIELGCGPGELARTLAMRGLEVVGVDQSEKKIALARERLPHVRFLASDIRDLEVTARYDSVVLSEVLEHVREQVGDAILAKAWSLVAAGGRLVVSVPHEDCVPHPNHVRRFDSAALAALLVRFGPPQLVTEQPYRYLLMYVDHA